MTASDEQDRPDAEPDPDAVWARFAALVAAPPGGAATPKARPRVVIFATRSESARAAALAARLIEKNGVRAETRTVEGHPPRATYARPLSQGENPGHGPAVGLWLGPAGS